jgi:8-amino-3,8-dideoxy-alpha-D-manno-octulosonate transaminase
MSELQAAVLLAQLRKLGGILAHLRANKQRFKSAIADLPGLEFREITDTQGECATLLTVFFPTEQIARQVANELGSKVVADSGWHVYSNMEHVLEKRTVTAEGCPFNCPYYKGPEPKYWKGMLPQTDALLARAMNISIGVSDVGLGSGFGVTMRDGFDVVDARVAEFRQAALKYL